MRFFRGQKLDLEDFLGSVKLPNHWHHFTKSSKFRRSRRSRKENDDDTTKHVDQSVEENNDASITLIGSHAGYKNTLGYYEIGENGEIKGVNIAFENVKGVKSGTEHSLGIDSAKAYDTGFFLIANGYRTNKGFRKFDFEKGDLEFVYDRGGENERPATIHDNAKDIDLVYTLNGREIVIKGHIYHATTEGEVNNLNIDGEDHAVTTVTENEDSTTIKFGFEDLKGLGDKDYNDLVFELNIKKVNQAPEAQDDVIDGLNNNIVTGNVLVDNGNGADTDADNDTLNVIATMIVTANGATVELLVNGDFTYTPNPADFTGSDSFEYTVTDGNGGQDTATVTLNIATNIVNGTEDADILTGTGFDEVIDVMGGNDTVNSGGGNDTVMGGSGNDTIRAGTGNDTVYGGDNNDFIYGEDGNDTLYGDGGNDYLYGNAGDDIIDGGEGIDSIFGGDGIDTINGGEGDDIIDGEDGDDVINGDEGADRIYGNSGNDDISGGDDDDILWGNAGDDILKGDAGNDTLYGYEDNDILIGGAGEDSLWGMDGADTFKFVTEDLDGTINRIRDFTVSENDKLDISDILIGYDPLTSDIADFVTFTAPNGQGDVVMGVDIDGAGTDHGNVWVAKLSTPGALDAQTLLDNGNLIA